MDNKSTLASPQPAQAESNPEQIEGEGRASARKRYAPPKLERHPTLPTVAAGWLSMEY